MADKPSKPGKRGRGRPPSEQPLRNHIGVKLPDELAEALEAYRASLKYPTNEPTIMRTALMQLLAAEGFWPLRRPGKGGNE